MAMVDISEVKGIGFIGSAALHSLVLAMVVISWETLSWENQAPSAQSTKLVAINLVRLSDRSTSPPSPQIAPVPQDKLGTVPQAEADEFALAPIVAPQPQPFTSSAPLLGETQKPQRETNSAKVVPKPVSPSAATTVRAPRPSPDEQLAAHLKLLAGLPQSVRPTSSDARHHDGIGLSNVTAAKPDTVRGRNATYAVTEAHPHSRHATESSRTRVAAYRGRWQSNPSNKSSPHANGYSLSEHPAKEGQQQLQMMTIAGGRQVVALPATARTAADSAPSSSTSSSSSGTASAGNGNGGNGNGGNGGNGGNSAAGNGGNGGNGGNSAAGNGGNGGNGGNSAAGNGGNGGNGGAGSAGVGNNASSANGANAAHGAALGAIGAALGGIASAAGHAGVGAGHGGGHGGGGR